MAPCCGKFADTYPWIEHWIVRLLPWTLGGANRCPGLEDARWGQKGDVWTYNSFARARMRVGSGSHFVRRGLVNGKPSPKAEATMQKIDIAALESALATDE